MYEIFVLSFKFTFCTLCYPFAASNEAAKIFYLGYSVGPQYVFSQNFEFTANFQL